MRGQALFEKVVEQCGVSAVLAPGLVRRALVDGKVTVDDATPADYRAALPRLVARLRAYMAEDEAQRRLRRITTMLQSIESGGPGASPTPPLGTSRITSPPSGEIPLPDYDLDEPTLLGRRYTAHEREVIRQSSALVGRDSEPDVDPDAGSADDPRKPRR